MVKQNLKHLYLIQEAPLDKTIRQYLAQVRAVRTGAIFKQLFALAQRGLAAGEVPDARRPLYLGGGRYTNLPLDEDLLGWLLREGAPRGLDILLSQMALVARLH